MNKQEHHIKGIIQHYQDMWGTSFTEKRSKDSAMNALDPGFRVLEYTNLPDRPEWAYATCGMSLAKNPKPIEIHLFSMKRDRKLVDLLSSIAYGYRNGDAMEVNDIVDFGRPWHKNSICDHGLVSLPFPDGAKMEVEKIQGKNTFFYWMIPITKREAEYKENWGIYDLNLVFDEPPLDYMNVKRVSAV